jgi:hypothetical protein
MIPFALGSSVAAIVAGITVTRTGSYRGIMWAAWAIMILGWGLMTTLDDQSNTWGMRFFYSSPLTFSGEGRRRSFIHWLLPLALVACSWYGDSLARLKLPIFF